MPAGGAAGLSPVQEALPKPAGFLAGRMREFRQSSKAGPAALLAFYRPPLSSRPGIELGVLSDVLSSGRTSRLVSRLVNQRKALSAGVTPAYPGEYTRD